MLNKMCDFVTLQPTPTLDTLHTSVFVHFLSSHHGGHCGVCPVVDDQILKHQEEVTDGVCAQLVIGGADGGRECSLRAAFVVRQLVEVSAKNEPGAFPGKGKTGEMKR